MAEKPIEIAGTQPIKAPIYANPAAVGLGAFGATTLLLQFHNFGLYCQRCSNVDGFLLRGSGSIYCGFPGI